MTDTTTIKTPAMDRLAAEEETLLAQVHEYRRSREVYYDRFNLAEVKETYAERKSGPGARHLVTLKASQSKAHYVAALARYDMDQSDLKVRLTALRRAATQEEDIIHQAETARTFEQVAADRREDIERHLAKGPYTDSDDLADLAFGYEQAFQVARCWAEVREYMDEENGPVEVLRGVRADVQRRILSTAEYGIVRSSSMTSNLKDEAKIRGLSAWLRKTERDAREIEVG